MLAETWAVENGFGRPEDLLTTEENGKLEGADPSVVSERALQEIYYPAFKAAIQEADAWSIMSCYNKLNGMFFFKNKPPEPNHRTVNERQQLVKPKGAILLS